MHDFYQSTWEAADNRQICHQGKVQYGIQTKFQARATYDAPSSRKQLNKQKTSQTMNETHQKGKIK